VHFVGGGGVRELERGEKRRGNFVLSVMDRMIKKGVYQGEASILSIKRRSFRSVVDLKEGVEFKKLKGTAGRRAEPEGECYALEVCDAFGIRNGGRVSTVFERKKAALAP